MGLLQGDARVNGKVVLDGTMTFALGPPVHTDAVVSPGAAHFNTRSTLPTLAARDAHTAHRACGRK